MDNGQSKFITKKIKVFGMVQGVGFRPLVYRIAKSLNISGSVRNVGGYVEILVQGNGEQLHNFVGELRSLKSIGCEIIRLDMEEVFREPLQEFVIIDSENSDRVSVIPPDLPVCQSCQEELYNENDRRFANPFISCMSCGPRYTILEELPYDRHNTSMMDFDMCPDCHEEYVSPKSRRFHAQTISCNDCGPYLIYQDCRWESTSYHNEKPIIDQEALKTAIRKLKQGSILAVKGIGGYHFVCSPFLEESVLRLRKLKGREEKPFAVMFPSLEEIKKYCVVSVEEEDLLQTAARPIVLLRMQNPAMAPSVNKKSIYCGAFLPYTPLQLLLTKECGPLIMTSANISDQPVIREDERLFTLKAPELDGVLYNTRRIVRSVDDSVAKVIDHKPQLLRRSRGYVPYPIFLSKDIFNTKQNGKESVIFAAGGDLKAAFCLYKEGRAVVSQYFGDLIQTSVMEEYGRSYEDLTALLKLKPELALCDLHPNYLSSHFTRELGIPVLPVQHHHAHIAAVMAEHDLRGKVIGVALDGTGYGTDGNVWGGEFLICEGAFFRRGAHLRYVKMLGGDQSMRDTKKTATCYLLSTGLKDYVKDDRKDVIEAALDHDINTVLTSSMGRLFDAVASILDLGEENRFEGECAALLEREAVRAISNQMEPKKLSYAMKEKDEIIEIDAKPLLKELCQYKDSTPSGALALGFHYATAEMIAEVCEGLRSQIGSNTVALGGGVFQNSVLTERCMELLRQRDFQVYINREVPPNDGAISLGQTYIGLHSQ